MARLDREERDFIASLTHQLAPIDHDAKLDSSKVGRARSFSDSEDRQEEKEEEYDFFFDAQTDENANEAQAYHVVDDSGTNDDDEAEDGGVSTQNMLENFRESFDQ